MNTISQSPAFVSLSTWPRLRRRKNEVLFLNSAGQPFAAVNRNGLLVQASTQEDGRIRFLHLASYTEKELGIDGLSFSAVHDLGKDLASLFFPVFSN